MEEAAKPARSPVVTLRRRVTVVVVGPRRRISRGQPPLKQLMKYAVPSMLVVLTLRYEANIEGLFGENPTPLWSFVATTVVYWIVVGAMRRRSMTPKKYEMLRRFALAFGIQSSLSLLEMFLPHPFSLLPLLIFVPFALFFVYTWICPRLIDRVRGTARELESTNQPHNLPV